MAARSAALRVVPGVLARIKRSAEQIFCRLTAFGRASSEQGDYRGDVGDIDDIHPAARPGRETAEQDPAQPFAVVATVGMVRR
jgi:hypothetical protein